MTSEKSCTDIPLTTPDEPAGETVVQRRERLAHLIGRLLARSWLNQRYEAEATDPTRSSPPDGGSS